jgi:ABC-2 type transport system permease protein
MGGIVRSELTRCRRGSFRLGWLGVTALFTVLMNVFVFSAPAHGISGNTQGPGGVFPTAAQLAGSHGMVTTLATATTFLGVVTLSFWAISAASDYTSGLIRVLVQAEPRRMRLLAGKVAALALWTALATTVAVVVSCLSAIGMASTTGISMSHWWAGIAGSLAGAWIDTYLALLVWGAIGLVIAVLTKSSTVAIAGGVAYVLIVESVFKLVASGVAPWLPGSVLSALASGGTAEVAYGSAVILGAAYAAVGLAAATLAFSRRDIVE